jgi:crotonobetainyl-CoA:carnitine CoA-transferase CaiB-like acyl-CoA transferase
MIRMPAFGLDGPWRDRPGFAMTVEQMSGLAWLTGYEDLPLVPRGACDPIGGMHTVFAFLVALIERANKGGGRLVEVPLVEVAINIAAEQVIEHSAYGQLLGRNLNRGPVSAPQGVYACADSDDLLALAVSSDASWLGLRRVLGEPSWAEDAKFETAAGRHGHHDELDEHLSAWFAKQPQAETLALLHEAGVAAEIAINAHDLMPHAQLEHREFFQTMTHPRTGQTRYPGTPLYFSGLPRALHTRPAPMLGEHTEEVLREELGVSEEEIEALRKAQVIGKRPSFM